jgi:GNAT superfamily N-acetyltransferase
MEGTVSEVRKITVHEFFYNPNTESLLSAYADECAIAGMPMPKPDFDLYAQMEKVGAYHAFAVLNDDFKMVGFAGLLISQNPHYSALIGTVESLFIAKEQRSGGLGLEMIRALKKFADDKGAVGLFSSAPSNSTLESVYDRLDCRCTNKVYFWGFK